jgi:hypothetical protein
MKDRNIKQDIFREGNGGRGRVNEEGRRRWVWSMCFLYKYEYGTLKPVEAISRRGRGRGIIMKEINKTRIHCTPMEMSQQNPLYGQTTVAQACNPSQEAITKEGLAEWLKE